MPLRLQALKNSRVFAGRRTNRAAPRTKNGPDTNHNEAGSGTKFTSGETASVDNDPSRFTLTSAAMPFGSAAIAALNSACVCQQRKMEGAGTAGQPLGESTAGPLNATSKKIEFRK